MQEKRLLNSLIILRGDQGLVFRIIHGCVQMLSIFQVGLLTHLVLDTWLG